MPAQLLSDVPRRCLPLRGSCPCIYSCVWNPRSIKGRTDSKLAHCGAPLMASGGFGLFGWCPPCLSHSRERPWCRLPSWWLLFWLGCFPWFHWFALYSGLSATRAQPERTQPGGWRPQSITYMVPLTPQGIIELTPPWNLSCLRAAYRRERNVRFRVRNVHCSFCSASCEFVSHLFQVFCFVPRFLRSGTVAST